MFEFCSGSDVVLMGAEERLQPSDAGFQVASKSDSRAPSLDKQLTGDQCDFEKFRITTLWEQRGHHQPFSLWQT